ncbi:MAG: thiamine pyrophosphate-binding protein [Candidatus Dadabacteria bacterium]|nr:thiamine pyrophosphate-binding protein [Candidatus Dadabacteria bacterium]
MTGKQGGMLLAETLYKLGVRRVFTLGGGHINPVYKACSQLGIALVDTHHEQGAAMAADAHARATGDPAVCLVTAGPGFTNTLTGMAVSRLANSPLVVISGRSGIEENDRLSLQEIDQEAMARPVAKWTRTVYETARIPRYVTDAWRAAKTGRPGPVYLGMSYEVLYPFCRSGEVEKPDFSEVENPPPPDGAVRETAKKIRAAKRPVFIAGSGAYYSGAGGELSELAKTVRAPVFTLHLGRGIIPDSSPWCFGPASPSSPFGFSEATARADFILLAGVRAGVFMGFGKTFNKKAAVAQIDIEPTEIGRNIAVEIPVAADVRATLKKLNRELKKSPPVFDRWTAEVQKIADRKSRAFFSEKAASTKRGKIHPVSVVEAVGGIAPKGTVFVPDGGDSQAWTDAACRVETRGGYIKGGPLGCMGVGLPFALGVKAARPRSPVVLITGDGALGMNFMEFETAVRHKLPVVIAVCNDGSWGMTRNQIRITYGEKAPLDGVMLGEMPFHRIAEAMGGHGEFVSEFGELEGALKRAFKSKKPAVVNIRTDPDAISPATYFITEPMRERMRG